MSNQQNKMLSFFCKYIKSFKINLIFSTDGYPVDVFGCNMWLSLTCSMFNTCSFSFPYPYSPPTAQCFDSQLYRVCKGGYPVWLLPESRMETRRLHDSCGGKYSDAPSHLTFDKLWPIYLHCTYIDIRSAESLLILRRRLKTHLF